MYKFLLALFVALWPIPSTVAD